AGDTRQSARLFDITREILLTSIVVAAHIKPDGAVRVSGATVVGKKAGHDALRQGVLRLRRSVRIRAVKAHRTGLDVVHSENPSHVGSRRMHKANSTVAHVAFSKAMLHDTARALPPAPLAKSVRLGELSGS